MKRHNTFLLNLASNFASRESGFIFAILGTMVQAAHTWMIAYDLSSLDGFWRLIQAGAMAFFISAALLYFVLKSSDGDNPRAKKWRKTVNMFAWLETCINLYYWGHKLLWEAWPDPDYGSFIIAIPFSFVIPLTLKAYSSEVRVEDFSDIDDNEPKENTETDGLSVADVEKIAKDLFDTNLKMNLSRIGLDLQTVDDGKTTITIVDNDSSEVYNALSKWYKHIHNKENVDECHLTEQQMNELIFEQPEVATEVIEPIATEQIVETITEQQEVATEVLEPTEQPEVNILGKEIANQLNNVIVSNGGFDTNPAYVAPQKKEANIEEDLFNYPK